MPTRKRSDVDSQPRMAGPLWIHTLRGELLGRQVALVCCGEAHEGTVLTLGFHRWFHVRTCLRSISTIAQDNVSDATLWWLFLI